MGDRIVIQITDGEEWSPDLYCHWLGLGAISAVEKAIGESRRGDVQNLMCNVVLEAMDRSPQEYSFYLENHGGPKHGDLDRGTWTWNIKTEMWTWEGRDYRTGSGEFTRELTMDEAVTYATEGIL